VLGLEQSDIAGTPQYQSPTAARGEHGDTRDDIYSFGAVLYEMLTGSAPYCGRTREEVLQQILAGPPRPILSLNPKAPVALVKIAEWAMARDLRDRYAHIGHVREDLELVARGVTLHVNLRGNSHNNLSDLGAGDHDNQAGCWDVVMEDWWCGCVQDV